MLDPAAQARRNLVKATLVAENTAFRPGETTELGFLFEIQKGWHLYWNGRNDSGLPPAIEVVLPEGFARGELLWPAPKRYVLPGDILDHIYEDRVMLLMPITVPPDAKPGVPVTITAKLDWLVCKDVCLPGDGEVSITLPVEEGGTAAPSPSAALFRETRARLPKPVPPAPPSGLPGVLDTRWEGTRLTLTAPDAAGLAFYPEEACAFMPDPIGQGEVKGSVIRLDFEPDGERGGVKGVLELKRAAGAPSQTPPQPSTFYRLDLPGPDSRGPGPK